jgi:hypothetical protein
MCISVLPKSSIPPSMLTDVSQTPLTTPTVNIIKAIESDLARNIHQFLYTVWSKGNSQSRKADVSIGQAQAFLVSEVSQISEVIFSSSASKPMGSFLVPPIGTKVLAFLMAALEKITIMHRGLSFWMALRAFCLIQFPVTGLSLMFIMDIE